MVKPSSTVVVVGGGPVGWACALACASASRSARVVLVERMPPPSPPQGMIDTRVYTVSHDNLEWLNKHGVALDMSRSAQVDAIRVFDQHGSLALRIDSSDARRTRLANVVEHDALTAAIATRAKALGVQFVQGSAKATGLVDHERYVALGDGSVLTASVVIVADGADSKLRTALGVATTAREYERVGVVAHFQLAKPHRCEARQWFAADRSILALLPLPDLHGKPAASMVWSTTAAHAEQLRHLNPSALCESVTNVAAGQVEITSALTPTAAFALRMVRVADPVAARAVVVGDAAHAVHPLAGQGVNLGFADARALEEALGAGELVGNDFGHALLLSKFRRNRYAAVLAMQAATDSLARIYNLDTSYLANTPQTLSAIGDLGMRILGKLPAFRRLVSSVAG